MGIDDKIIWNISLPGVGTGHAFKIQSAQEGHYYVSRTGELYREVSGSYHHVDTFTGDITFYDNATTTFNANFKNGVARLIWFS